MRKYELYVEAFRKANHHLPKKAQYDATQKLWNDVKKDNDFFNQKIHEFKLKGSNLELINDKCGPNYAKIHH